MSAEELETLADRLDAAVHETYDTGEDGESYEYIYYAEGQGEGRLYGSTASEFIREIAKRAES